MNCDCASSLLRPISLCDSLERPAKAVFQATSVRLRRQHRMRFSILILFLVCFSGFAGQQGVTQSFTQTEPKDWSYDIIGDYTLGSRILKASRLGSQATYHYGLEALRNFKLSGRYYLQAGIEAEQFVFSRSDGNAFPS
jgi:hypothetical protein